MLLPITYLFTSNAENNIHVQFAHLHNAGKDAATQRRKEAQKKCEKTVKKLAKNLRISLIFSIFVSR